MGFGLGGSRRRARLSAGHATPIRWSRRRRALLVGAMVLPHLLFIAAPASAYQRPGFTHHVSIGPDGAEGNANCFDHDVTADGRYVVFTCSASNLVPNDTNGRSDIFVRDIVESMTERVSLSASGEQTNANSFHPSVSHDGRYVAFASDASNLVPGDTNGARDVFLVDLGAGTIELISVSSEGAQGNRGSELPSISADGSFVAFQSEASNLVPDDTNSTGLWPADVFVRDLAAGTTDRVSLSSAEVEQNGRAHRASISGDGRYVAFQSLASNLDGDDTNGTWDVFVRDRNEKTTERVSVSSDGEQGDGSSLWASISADGRFVAFDSLATNLVPNDDNQEYNGTGNDDGRDVFVHDRETGETERVSLRSDGAERPDGTTSGGATVRAEDRSEQPSISADGRFVAYGNNHIQAAEGQPGLFLRIYDVHVHDRLTGTTEVVTVTTDGAGPRGVASYLPSISATGRFVAFSTHANNIAPTAKNNAIDVHVRDRGPAIGPFGTTMTVSGDEVTVAGHARFGGEVVTAANDATGDAGPAGSETGGDITRAQVVSRPEEEDLLLKASVPGLPPPRGGLPGFVYGFRFTVGGAVYEARATRVTTSTSAGDSDFALYRCMSVCLEQERVGGGIGTAGHEVRIAVPYRALSLGEDAEVSEIRAYAAVGHTVSGALATMDEVALPDAPLPGPQVSLGIAPAGSAVDEVAFDHDADVAEGAFSGTLDVSALAPGDYEMWARACLGELCGAASHPLTIAGDGTEDAVATTLTLTIEGRGSHRVLSARLTEQDEDATPVAGAAIDFFADAEHIGTVVTDGAGVATLQAPPRYRGGKHTFEARFDGDDRHLPSSVGTST